MHAPVPAPSPINPEVLDALPPGVTGEIVGGELYTSPRPAAPHQSFSTRMSRSFAPLERRRRGGDPPPGGWVILAEVELRLSHARTGAVVLVPDASGWRRERMPVVPSTANITLVPDWVCEILSPSSVGYDRIIKMNAYADLGVLNVWIIDPLARVLEVYRLTDELYTRVAAFTGDSLARIEPFADVELDIGEWWPDDPE